MPTAPGILMGSEARMVCDCTWKVTFEAPGVLVMFYFMIHYKVFALQ